MNLVKEIEENQNIVLVLNESEYKGSIIKLNQKLSKVVGSICYVSITTHVKSLAETFVNKGISIENYKFVGCSKKHGEEPVTPDSRFIAAPTALTELAIEVSKAIKDETELLFLDSISSLTVHNDEFKTVKFLHHLITLTKGTNTRGLYIILKSDFEKGLMKELALFADKIIEYASLE